jgi:GNAT superfamily N-acetyltransferase
LLLHWNPHAQPAGLEQELQAMGFSLPQRRSWAKMLRSPDAPPAVATSLQVREAQASEMREVAAIAAQAFDMPPFMADWLACLHGGSPWHMYAVLDGAQVVGGGMLWVRGDAAWLGIGSVAPSHRRRGGQQALMALRIAAAGQHGARHVVTETGEPTAAGEANPSLANMKRCGFRQVASRLNFAAPA